MKSTEIRFYSSQDNSLVKEKSSPKPVTITGYVSNGGKLVFPQKTVAQLAFDPDTTRFKIGTQPGKRKVKSLYLVPAENEQDGAFKLVKAAKSYTIPLAVILQKGGVDYANAKFNFTVKPFEFETGITAYELQLSTDAPKPAYTGKPRGRKRREEAV